VKDNPSDTKRKFIEWQAYVMAHPGVAWELGKVYDTARGWCPIWKVGDKAMTLNVGGARVFLKHMREDLTAAFAGLDAESRNKIQPDQIMSWLSDYEDCVTQCMHLNEQGAVPKQLGGNYEEPLAETSEAAGIMASLRPDGSEGDPLALQQAGMEALAKAPRNEQIMGVAQSVYGFLRELDGHAIEAETLAAGTHLALYLLVLGALLGPNASDDAVLKFITEANAHVLPLARLAVAMSDQPDEPKPERFGAGTA